jgi:hypothetical protein
VASRSMSRWGVQASAVRGGAGRYQGPVLWVWTVPHNERRQTDCCGSCTTVWKKVEHKWVTRGTISLWGVQAINTRNGVWWVAGASCFV